MTLFAPESVCFIAIISLKQPTPKYSLDHQRKLNPTFRLNSPHANLDSVSLAPDVDVPQWSHLAATGDYTYYGDNHPIEIRKLDMTQFNTGKEVSDKVQVGGSRAC